ncbi:Sec-independent protein translocase protein TatB [Xenophilus arseniciresistens]|uniref:Sec-independent protein translocase protein TatB n=1 Tax=Xenophilus arseniciresistens TaxID=1283306 RepID=A0AAE3N590_9BURK|nr:Sec-independent protein translocase protein TatB [Xenophilus arseniciresistens]MDA7415471.1 Sec-independent protein translocase protein TatB [Xenophilus arseniciresistens]
MIDLGISKIALIGAVALIVIGPEKLPRVARTVGTLLGKAQRYVNDVKAEVNRSMELDELRKMKDTVEGAARDVEGSIRTGAQDVQDKLSFSDNASGDGGGLDTASAFEPAPLYPSYRHPGKKWRLKQGAVPQWYKARAGVRSKALSGAARVARHRPRRFK